MENKYQQLKTDFLSEFVLGKHLPGTALPSEREIAVSYGLSRVSVRHAIDDLIKGGYLEKTGNGRNVICGLPVERSSRKLFLITRNVHSVLPDIYRMLYEALAIKCYFSDISLFCCEEKRLAQTAANTIHFNAVLGFGLDPQQKARQISADRFLTMDEIDGSISPRIATDNYIGGRLAAEHLRQCGCRHTLLFDISSKQPYLPFLKRKQGFTDYMKEHGIPVSFCKVTNSSPRSCFAALQECPQLGKADGLFVIHDYLAVNVLHALRKLEISVPGQMAVIGFDGIPGGGYLLPSLTTVEQPVNTIADKALELAFGTEPVLESILIPPQIIQRKSTAPAAETGTR